MTGSRRGKVYKVLLVPPMDTPLITKFRSVDEYILDALSPGRSVVRYQREWIVGQTTVDNRILSGRIGFRGADGMAEVWNEERRDFEAVAVPAGLTAPFAVNLRSLEMALQPRGAAIKLNGLIGAFRGLLSREEGGWRILTRHKQISFENWRASVDRITAVKFSLRKPNPRWVGAPDLQTVMETAKAEVVSLEARSVEGLDTESGFIAQSQRHVERGYGESQYVGERGTGTSEVHESVYNSRLGSEEDSVEVPLGPDGEVSASDLANTLADRNDPQDT